MRIAHEYERLAVRTLARTRDRVPNSSYAGHSGIQNEPVKMKAPVALMFRPGATGAGLRISNVNLRSFAYTNMTPSLKAGDCDISANYPYPSFDYLVGDRQQLIRHVEPDRLGSFSVYDKLELGGLCHRQVCRLFALENLAHINAGFAISVRNAAVAHETACNDERAIIIDCRNGVTFRQRDQLLAPAIKKGIGGDKKRSRSPLCRNRKGETDLVFTACLKDAYLLSGGASRLLNIFRLGIESRPRRVQEHAD
jgi:hypothetical protein